LDIESRRLVEAANGMIKQDVRVLEKPRRQDKGERDPHETGPNCESKQHREHHQDPSSSAANRSDKMAEETWVDYCQLDGRSIGRARRSVNQDAFLQYRCFE
jgi:hypothetical protein